MAEKGNPEGTGRGTFDPAGRFDRMTGWRRPLTVIIFLIVVLCLLVPELVFLDRIFLAPDTKAPLSFRTVGREALDEGSYPLWNPYLFCGMPSFSSLSYTPYVYPVSFVTHVLYTYLGFPYMTWLLIHYLAAGAGMYLLLRSCGARPSVSLLAGALFMVMPNYVAAGANGHGSQASAVAWMPLALLLAWKVLRGRRRIVSAALLSIVLGFQMLRGHVQISYYTFLLVGLLFLFEAGAMARSRRWKPLGSGGAILAASILLALGIASVLILPVRDYAQYSIRGGGEGGGLDYGYATGWSLHPREMLTFVFPWASGYGKATYWGRMPFTDYPNYLGLFTVFFAAAGLFIVRGRKKYFFATTAVLATLISFGRFFPLLYDPLFELLPWFNKFRVPVMILIVQQLALVVMAGLALEEYLRRLAAGDLPRWLSPAAMKWALIACAALLVLSLAGGEAVREGIAGRPEVTSRVKGEWLGLAGGKYAADLVRTFLILALVAAVLYAAPARRFPAGLIVTALAVVALADLLVVDRAIVHPEDTWRSREYRLIRPASAKEDLTEPDPAAEWLASREGRFRVFPVPAQRIGNWSHNSYPFSDNSFMMAELFSLGGYHAAKLQNYQSVMDRMFAVFNRGNFPMPLLNMLNARYFVSLFPLFRDESPFPLVYEDGTTWIYENPGAAPRVFFVDTHRVMKRERILEEIASPSFDPLSEALLEKEPPPGSGEPGASSARITEYRLNSVRIEAEVENACLMVASEIFYPDWRALVDGEEKEILVADYCLRALPLEPGRHEIVFEYHSPVIRTSLAISIASLAVALLAAAAAYARKGK